MYAPFNISNSILTCSKDPTGATSYNYTCLPGFAFANTEILDLDIFNNESKPVFYVVARLENGGYNVTPSVPDLRCVKRNCTSSQYPYKNEISTGSSYGAWLKVYNQLLPLLQFVYENNGSYTRELGTVLDYGCTSSQYYQMMVRSGNGTWVPDLNMTKVHLATCVFNSSSNGKIENKRETSTNPDIVLMTTFELKSKHF